MTYHSPPSLVKLSNIENYFLGIAGPLVTADPVEVADPEAVTEGAGFWKFFVISSIGQLFTVVLTS
jgi:hypothetical protein